MSNAQLSRSEDFDVVVIGSGFGGSVAANRLALAGQRVLVLERGPWRDSVPVRAMGIQRRSPFPYGSKAITHFLHSLHLGRFHLRLHKSAMYELFSFGGLRAMVANAVGGGSTAYGGLLEAPCNPDLWLGRHPEFDPASVERYYDKVITDMGGVRPAREHPLPQFVWSHLPDTVGKRCHPVDPQPHMGLLIPPTAAQAGQAVTFGPAAVTRQYCSFDGDSFLGSRGGAKASVDFVYLAPVLKRGVTVRDLCQVNSIQPSGASEGYLVHCTNLTTKADAVVRAKRVVLAAGCLNTVRLLFASSRLPNGLKRMPSLGRNFGANGDSIGLWYRKSPPLPSFTSTPSQGAFTVAGHDAPCYGMGGFAGFETLPIPSFIKRRLARTFFMYGIGVDSGSASVTYENRHLQVDYDQRREPIYDDIRQGFDVLATESGDKIWTLPTPLTVHPWGGACLGADAEHGVVDHHGEIYGNPGLFIADAAALPAAPGGPPAVTIAAWAHHVADAIAPLDHA